MDLLQGTTFIMVSMHEVFNKYIYIYIYCILRGQIKGLNRSVTTILFKVGSYRTLIG